MGLQLMLLAALFVAGSNLFFRKSLDNGGSSRAFLMVQLFLTFVIAVLLNPVRTGDYAWNFPLAFFGFCGGILLAAFMAMMGKALELGPPGLTFAVINASSVMPILLMVGLFGTAFGFSYSLWNGAGSILVVAGLFWAAREAIKGKKSFMWAIYALMAFALHTLFLAFMQWRALFLNYPGKRALFLSFDRSEVTSTWFMPMIFLAAAMVQTYLFFTTERRKPSRAEVRYGVVAGIANGIGTYFMIWSTEVATALEQAMIFPLFSVAVIIFCNFWGRKLYQEQVNWAANALCVLGLILGTVNWQAIF